MYKIAGELTSTVFHVSARSLAASALSIFGDHQDVMACRQIGWAMLASNSVQEVMDSALIAQAATLKSRVPFLHFFDGFRTSHEVSKVEMIADDVIRAMISDQLVADHRARALNPEKPFIRGTAQNPDVYFQGREAVNKFYEACPEIVAATMEEFGKLTGRVYKPFDYIGAPDADRVIVLMGSSAETALETIEALRKNGEKVGAVVVRLYRPFSSKYFFAALPKTAKAIAVLDRTKEPGSDGEPLYKDILTAPRAGRRGRRLPGHAQGRRRPLRAVLQGFTPGMVKAVFDELKKSQPKNGFTVGIVDDVTHTSLDVDPKFFLAHPGVTNAMFFASAPTAPWARTRTPSRSSARKPTSTRRATSCTTRRSPARARRRTAVRPQPDPQPVPDPEGQLHRLPPVRVPLPDRHPALPSDGAVFLLNSPFAKDEVWNKLPKKVQAQILEKKIKFYNIDGYAVAERTGMGSRVNTIMQTCFFAISGVLPRTRRSRRSSTRSRRPTARRATKSSRRTTRRWTRPSPTCTKSRTAP
jgi:pyruvate-ferredoxin/flavodoxin oxidoreductase